MPNHVEPLSLDDDEDERKPINPLVWVGIGLAGILTMAGTVGILMWLAPKHRDVAKTPESVSSAPAAASPAPIAEDVEKKVYLRDEFKGLAYGKSTAEILKTFGKPERTKDFDRGAVSWYYVNRTRDPISGKMDAVTHLKFIEGRVYEIIF